MLFRSQKEQFLSAARDYRSHCSTVHSSLKEALPTHIFDRNSLEGMAAVMGKVMDKWTPIMMAGAEDKPEATMVVANIT